MSISIDCPDPSATNVTVGTTFCVRGSFTPPAGLKWVRVVVVCGSDTWVGKTTFAAQSSASAVGYCFKFTGVTDGCKPTITVEVCGGAGGMSQVINNVTVTSSGSTTDCCSNFNCPDAQKLPAGQPLQACAQSE